MKLRMNNPAQISSRSESEICATTSPLVRRVFRSPPDKVPRILFQNLYWG